MERNGRSASGQRSQSPKSMNRNPSPPKSPKVIQKDEIDPAPNSTEEDVSEDNVKEIEKETVQSVISNPTKGKSSNQRPPNVVKKSKNAEAHNFVSLLLLGFLS